MHVQAAAVVLVPDIIGYSGWLHVISALLEPAGGVPSTWLETYFGCEGYGGCVAPPGWGGYGYGNYGEYGEYGYGGDDIAFGWP